MSIRAGHEPRARQLREAEQAAWDREAAAAGAWKALEAKLTTEQRDLTTELLDHWHRQHVDAYQAAAVLRAGSGRLGQHRRQVREARADLTAWAQRWQPVLADLPTDPDQIRRHLEAPPERMRGDRLRQQIADTAQQAIARAHPEAEPIRVEAAAAHRAVREAHDAATAFDTQLDRQLRPHRWARARHDALPELLEETRSELDNLGARLDDANTRIQRLLRSPEIRSLPPGSIRTEHDQWRADRTAAQEAARVAAAARAAEQRRLAAEQAQRHGIEPPARSGRSSSGPAMGL